MVNIGLGFTNGYAACDNELGCWQNHSPVVLHIAGVPGVEKFGGGLEAVQPGIALFWANPVIPGTICTWRKPA